MKRSATYERVLAVYPCWKGFGFAVIERGRGVIDWGRAELSHDSTDRFQARLRDQIERCDPAVVAVEDYSGSLRTPRSRARVATTVALAKRLSLAVIAFSPTTLRAALGVSPSFTRHDIAADLCDRYPELSRQMPGRFAWKTDPRLVYFQAVALAAAAMASPVRRKARA